MGPPFAVFGQLERVTEVAPHLTGITLGVLRSPDPDDGKSFALN